jgi:O-antigen ligase
VLLVVAVFLVAVGVATTSIKTNLGIAVGVVAAGVVNFRYGLSMLRRNALVLLAVTAALAYAVASNEVVVQSMQRGIDRVALGIEILYQREDLPGYSGFEKRSAWQEEGLKGWSQNPLFGHGVEAFRSRFGITSHATPVDLLYNSGLIGLVLFYGVLASVLRRLYEARQHVGQDLRVTILGALVCYLVISLAGTMHYNTFLAAFVALSSGLLDQYRERRALPAIGMVVHS